MDLARHDTEAAHQRRLRLADALSGAPALIPAGAPIGRNFPANHYPFRASSHFLYLVGLPLAEAFLLLHGGRSRLFLPEPAEDDSLWHGPQLGWDALAAATGAEVRAAAALPDALAQVEGPLGTLPGPDLATRRRQSELLGRAVGDGAPRTSEDLRLARAMVALRLRHDEAARSEIRRAVGTTVAAHLCGMGRTHPGVTEALVCAEMEAQLGRRGMSPAYGSIVTVHGEVLHDPSHDRVLRPGELLLCDLGAESREGWAADVTRTWPVDGRFSPTQRELYQAVSRSQAAAIAAVRPGARFRDVHLAAERALGAALVELGILRGDVEELVADGVVALFFPHGVGHLLGLDVHDMEDLGDLAGYPEGRSRDPRFGLRNLRLDRDLEPDMVVTVEPGFYQVPAILADPERHVPLRGRLDRTQLARFADVRGIRIEDDVLVTEDGANVLTAALPKEAAAVEDAVGRGG